MNYLRLITFLIALFGFLISCTIGTVKTSVDQEVETLEVDHSGSQDWEERIVSYELDPSKSDLRLFWKDSLGQIISNSARLVELIQYENKELHFAMNGGMYLKDQSPQGLYIENGKLIRPINSKKSDYGNFYLEPNGVFLLRRDGTADIIKTANYKDGEQIKYATQSGPLLLHNGKYHPAIKEGSKNLHIRNGVGIKENGQLVFAQSKELINFFDFASFFSERNCTDALYLDGFVSRMYLPEKDWIQTDGKFGVIIGEVR